MHELERLVGDTTGFASEIFDASPQVYCGQGMFDDLFSLAAADELVTGRVLPAGTTIRVADAHATTPPEWTTQIDTAFTAPLLVASAEATVAAFSEGATIVFQGLHRQVDALADFAYGLSREMWAEVGINGYLSPAHAQGLAAHFDDHDVFVVQLSGSKTWDIFAPATEWPLVGAARAQSEVNTDPVQNVELSAGDVMYLPRGWPHCAQTASSASLHLTISVTTRTAADIVADIVREAVVSLPGLRRSTGLGHRPDPDQVRKLAIDHLAAIATWIENSDAGEFEAIASSRPSNQPAQSGRLSDMIRLDSLTGECRLRWRHDAQTTWRRADGSLELVVRDITVRLPGAFEAALIRLDAGEVLCVNDLVENMRGDAVVLLAQQLLRHGVLALAHERSHALR